ncbi:hypothetical protein G6646_09505 [Polynucleobacter paneuropaeus]|jgi:hypothetical protein|nr:hypothetical protein [Polynucleobacter paneuropaeus]MBT8581163.1 hypothetical protein [Polynucleobacter paneuropaeus]
MRIFFSRLILLSLVALSLLACAAGFPKTNSDPAKNNAKTFNQDLNDCIEVYPETYGGIQIKQRISCMNLKGWH